MKTYFGEWLRQRRSLLRSSRKECAQQAHISPITLKDYEIGRRRPSDDAALALVAVLRVPASLHDDFMQMVRGGEPSAALIQLTHKGLSSKSHAPTLAAPQAFTPAIHPTVWPRGRPGWVGPTVNPNTGALAQPARAARCGQESHNIMPT
ncbi:MAG: helix-turn-helix transcriptional regulator [Anaerolineae bacterium]|nr:helix-turn-helix transcriptional regulator [Anaerolineae bacterium]